ncbi:MAG: transporter substrate-binding domain-containing protein [Planctomycetes bacterium]|nr:transporter substrate-binding domain-containing protein [Planctomycetota bacterium]
MRHLILALAILLLAACGGGDRTAGPAGRSVLDRVLASGTVRVGVKADSPPFGVERSGARMGFDIDIAQAVARRLGVEAAFVTVTSADRIPRLVAGEVDMVVASMTQTRSRERQVDFSVPYFEDGPAVLVGTASGIDGYVALGGRKVGVAKGSTTAQSLATIAPEAVLVELPAIADLMPALRSGTVDAIASDYLILLALRRTEAEPGRWAIPGGRIVAEPYGIALPQDQSAWRDAVNAALMAMWEDGEWARISDAWFGQQSAMPADVRFVLPTIPR